MEQITISEGIRKEVKEIVIARLETLNRDSKIILLGLGGSVSVAKLIDEVKKDSEFGRKVVEVQYAYLKMLTSGKI